MNRIFCTLLLLPVFISGNCQTAKEYYDAGSKQFYQKDYKSAIENFTKALDLDPGIQQAYESRGNARYNLNDFSGALEDFNKAIQLIANQKSPDLFSRRGLAKTALKDYQGAIDDFSAAIEQSNQSEIKYYIYRGSAKFFSREYEGSIADCNVAINSTIPEINKSEAYYWKGLSKIFMGQQDEGCKDLKISLKTGYARATDAIKNYCQ
jgi:tetratricopeptide (TPR) repeat protein